jgi:hypothetical protein
MYTILYQPFVLFLIILNLAFLGLTIFAMTYLVDHFVSVKQLTAKNIQDRRSILNGLLVILLGWTFSLFFLVKKIFDTQNVGWSLLITISLSVVIYIVIYIRYQRKRT